MRAVRSTLEALGKQTYANFEVCVVSELAQAGLTDYEGIPKFRLVLFNGTAHEQLKASREDALNGAYFLQLLPGDLPAPDALHMLVLQTHANPEAEVVFADEDSVIDGIRQNPIFKPDYGRDTLRSFNSIGRPMLVSKRVHTAVGGFRGSTPAELWAYCIDCASVAKQVIHIARIGLTVIRDCDGSEIPCTDILKREFNSFIPATVRERKTAQTDTALRAAFWVHFVCVTRENANPPSALLSQVRTELKTFSDALTRRRCSQRLIADELSLRMTAAEMS